MNRQASRPGYGAGSEIGLTPAAGSQMPLAGGNHMRRLLAIVTVLLAAGGAGAKDLPFLVVDADTGEPLAGVKVSQRAQMWQPGTVPIIVRGPFGNLTKKTTDAAGTVTFRVSAGDDVYYFEHPGYENAGVFGEWWRWAVGPCPYKNRVTAMRKDGKLYVRMHKKPAG